MTASYRLQKAVGEVEPLLEQVRQDSPELLEGFPRPVEDIAIVSGGDLSIHVAKLDDLTEAKAARYLRDQLGITGSGLDMGNTKEYLGLLVCLDSRAFLFCDPGLGDACFRFTLAHELGHLFNEYIPSFSRREQLGLFAATSATHFAHRDSSISVAEGLEGTMAELRQVVQQRRGRDWLNEVKANAFAAELLAPEREVRALVAGLDQENERVARVAERFGLSRRAAEIRVAELLAPESVGWLFGVQQALGVLGNFGCL